MHRAKLIRVAGVVAAVGAIVGGGIAVYRHYRIKGFHVVDSAGLYRSAQPQGPNWEELRQEYGVRTVVSLREWNADPDNPDLRTEEAATRRLGIRLIKIDVPRGGLPTHEQTDEFLRLAGDRGNWPMLFHCQAGRDRTGVACAAYRMYVEGWSLARADEEMDRLHSHDKPFLNHWLDEYARHRQGSPDCDCRSRPG
jgi:protein tyrosine/serine phosphatase